MAIQPEIRNLALFCDFENVALGVREAKYAQFDINKVLSSACCSRAASSSRKRIATGSATRTSVRPCTTPRSS